ncbi:hypothetical protein GTW59_22605, partial [Streptomyces sp. SID89]|nr:hypothetical protein [Streptomyces sp. SID89]
MRRTSPRALSAAVLAGLIAGSAATTAYAAPATESAPRPNTLGRTGAAALRHASAPDG